MTSDLNKLLYKAQCHVQEGKILEAQEVYKQILIKFPKNKKAIREYGRIATPSKEKVDVLLAYFNNGQYIEAVELGELLSMQFPSSIIVYEIVGAANMRLGNIGQTLKNYKKILEIFPKHTDAYNSLGIVFYDLGQYSDAIKCYRTVVELEPGFADGHYNLGNALKQSGSLKKAIESYQKSLAICPDDAEVLQQCGNAFRDFGDLDQAIEHYTRALGVGGEFAEAFGSLGAKELERGNWSTALASYEQSSKFNKDEENNHLLLFLNRLKHIKDLNVFAEVVSKIAEAVLLEIRNPVFIKHFDDFFTLILFSKHNAKEQTDILFEYWAVPWINQKYDDDKIDFAMYLENIFYTLYVKNTETEEHFFKSTSLIKDAAVKAGRRYQHNLPIFVQTKETQTRKIGFFLHNSAMLAHVEVLYEFLKSANKNSRPDFEPFIFCFAENRLEMLEKFSGIDVKVITLATDAKGQIINSQFGRLLRLRNLCREMQIHTMVWVSLVIHMAFTFSMRIAPHQVWWSMKWANYSIPDIDKRMSSFSFKRNEILHNEVFLSGRMQFSNLVGLHSKTSASKLRKSFKDKVILGTMGREEKLKDPIFLSTVSEILKQNNNAIFMWTGRYEDAYIKSFFEEKNVEPQVKFIGWVDTQVYAHVFDVHLDSFPFGNGVTALQSMAAATPVVLHKSSMLGCTNLDNMIGPLFNDDSIEDDYREKALNIFFNDENQEILYQAAPDRDIYFQMVQRLINDKTYRRTVGNAYCRFINEMMSNPNETSKIFTEHLLN